MTSFYIRKFSKGKMMKKVIFVFLLAILLTAGVNAQVNMSQGPGQGPMKKIEELERVKLIEVLNMDEQTTLKFFSRRNKYRQDQFKLFIESNDLLKNLDTEVNKEKPESNETKDLVSKYLEIENKISDNRLDFIRSLKDILTPKQIGKYIVFERKFRDEIRQMIFRERRRGMR